MSVARYATIQVHCDTAGCRAQATFTGDNPSDARSKAVRSRWRLGRTKAKCGSCKDIEYGKPPFDAGTR